MQGPSKMCLLDFPCYDENVKFHLKVVIGEKFDLAVVVAPDVVVSLLPEDGLAVILRLDEVG